MSLCSLLMSVALATPPPLDSPLEGAERRWRDAAVLLSVENPAQGEPLPGLHADAELLRESLHVSLGLSSSRVRQLSEPSRAEVDAQLRRSLRRVRRRGTLWVVLLGRGGASSEGAWLDLTDGVLPLAELIELALQTRAERVVLLADIRTDGGDRANPELPRTGAPVVWTTEEDPRLVVWPADRRGMPTVFPSVQRGAFPWLVAASLRGWADGAPGHPEDGGVSLGEAMRWVSSMAPRLGLPIEPGVDRRPELAEATLRSEALEAAPEDAVVSAWRAEDRALRLSEAEERVQQAAAVALTRAVADARMAGEVGPLEEFVAEQEHATLRLELAVPIDAVAQARALLADPDSLREDAPDAQPEPVADPAADDCDDLYAMEAAALAGTFTEARLACLDERWAEASITERDKLSRLLLANAEASGDAEAWAFLARRHLEEIDRSDPDLCLAYALHLSEAGLGEEAIAWADRALANKTRWQGERFQRGVATIYRLKAETAYQRWLDVKDEFSVAPTPASGDAMERWRGHAKNFAREWLDYADASGMDTTRARDLCLSAAGSSGFCVGG